MRRLLLISLATIPLAGCQFFNRGESDTPVIDLVEAVESGEALVTPTIPTLGGGEGDEVATDESFTDPTVASQSTGTVSADLISSTDPAARARQVQRSRTDPFAALPIPPAPEPVISPVAAQSNNAAANSGANAGGASSAGSGGAAAGVAASTPSEPTPPPVRVQPNNEPLVLPSPITQLPPVPQPVIAPTVSVSGVIQMGNEPYAILRSGSEPERYVRVGDRIAGGAVRVKRIETLAFEPRVILEENGIEVSRPIASEGASSEPGPLASSSTPVGITPVAAVPVVAPGGLSSPLPVPAAVLPNTQAVVPDMVLLPASAENLTPAAGEIPSSLLLQPADTNAQAVLPNLQRVVPGV